MPHQTHTIDDLHRGQNATQPITVENTDGTAKDLTGATVYFYALNDPDDDVHEGGDAAALSKDSSGSEVTITDATNGDVEVDFLPGDYSSIPGYDHAYEVWVEDAAGDQTLVLSGTIDLDKPG